jgi:hypothetical protein
VIEEEEEESVVDLDLAVTVDLTDKVMHNFIIQIPRLKLRLRSG